MEAPRGKAAPPGDREDGVSMTGKCGVCLAEWGGFSQCHCGACHEMFGSLAAFDRHRVDFACLPVEQFSELMRKRDGSPGKPRLVRGGRGLWVTALGNWREGAESSQSTRSGQN